MNKIFLSNIILYKLYLYYNLFYRYGAFKKKLTYSQNQEDLFINDYFKGLKSGLYMDIGCYHPIRYSNTALLFNRGWRGINIDMNQTSIDLFNIIRKKDITPVYIESAVRWSKWSYRNILLLKYIYPVCIAAEFRPAGASECKNFDIMIREEIFLRG